MAGFCSRQASIPFVVSSVAIVFLTCPATSQSARASELIRCPDWQSLIPKTASLRSTPPKRSFEAKLAEKRAKESQVASLQKQVGQGVRTTGTPTSTRSASLRATPESVPLDAAGIFSREGRDGGRTAKKPTSKPQASTSCPTHTVRKGDTIAKISRAKFGSLARYHDIIAANTQTLKNPNILPIGTVLTLPCTGPASIAKAKSRQGVASQGATKQRAARAQASKSKAASKCQYTVVAGDTLPKIAKRQLGNTRRWTELAKVNALSSNAILRIGQILTLPCAPGGQQGQGSTPTKAPLPVWTARPGEFVSDVITRWAKVAGHTVVRDGIEEWKLSVPVRIRGHFKHALDQLVTGFEGSGRPLAISIYANKVIRIGRPL